jgi:MYXO-CTERM domain-containing protein
MRLLLVPTVLCLAVLTPVASAWAEETDAAKQACTGKSEGDNCSMMKLEKPPGGGELVRTQQAGTCQPGECCELDYAKGSPPETTCGPCLVCKPGAAPTPTPEPETTPSSEPPRASADEPPASAGNDKRGCAVGGHDPAGPAVLLLGLLVWRRRS